jgi:hypothetical protein
VGGALAGAQAYAAGSTLLDASAADASLIAVTGVLGILPFVVLPVILIAGAVYLSYLEQQAICGS